MSIKNSFGASSIALLLASAFGAWALNFISNHPEFNYCSYFIPALTTVVASVFRIVISFGSMSATEMAATFSSYSYFKELKKQINDPLISEKSREARKREYDEALGTKLAMKKGKFSIFSAANQRAIKQADNVLQQGLDDSDTQTIDAQIKQFQCDNQSKQ